MGAFERNRLWRQRSAARFQRCASRTRPAPGLAREAGRVAGTPLVDAQGLDGAAKILKPLPQVLVLDTCVLISNVLRLAFSQLAADGCFRLAWSAVIGDEWRRNAARIWRVPDAEVQQLW